MVGLLPLYCATVVLIRHMLYNVGDTAPFFLLRRNLMSLDKNEHLTNVLETHRMTHIERLLEKCKSKREEIKSALTENYGSKAYNPFSSGSFKKHTAINIKFDLDVVAPFKKNSFKTLEEMFDDVYNFLYNKYKDEAVIKKQKVSIGLEFHADEDGDTVCVDVSPGRELNQDQYKEDGYLNLFVNSRYGLIEEKSSRQTNIQKQIDHIKAKGDERKIIRFLKVWKFTNNGECKSFFLELFTIKAFDKVAVSGNYWEMLKTVMEYIRDNVTKDNFKLVDPGNSNNDLMDTLDSTGRTNISERMKTIIKRIEEDSENISTYFPLNEKFQDKASTSNEKTYDFKAPAVSFSMPKSSERFG